MKLNFYCFISVFIVGFCFQTVHSQDIVFNEVMSSNTGTIWDEDNDTPDWFELYNNGSTSIDLSQYVVDDDPDTTGSWAFPFYVLDPGKYLLVYASSKDRKDLPLYWETIITQGDTFRYVVPASEPSSLWRSVSYNDSSWGEGKSGFGYSDGDDNTVLASGITSVFIRKKFTIEDISHVKEAILHMDYDDGFVAYINGVEIARANISSVGPPAFNAYTTQDHEAQIYAGGVPDAFPIEDITSVLVEGENVLAIQVHNVSATSSDMSAIPFLSIGCDVPVSGSVVTYIEVPMAKLHANFKISADGETLYLFKDNVITDSVQVPFLPTDISYGRNQAGDLSWKYFSESTPESINNTTPYDTLSSQVIFSVPGGIYNSPFSVALTAGNAGGNIYYTIDGTEPTASSAKYSIPIPVYNTTNLKARVIKAGAIPGFSSTESYLFNISHDLPVISLVTDPANFFDDYTGIYVDGAVRFPSSGKDCDNGQNFWQDWEKPVHVSMFNTDGNIEFEQNAGVKIFGGCSRTFAQKSLSLRFRKGYEKDGLKYKMFDELDIDKFYSINLRNSGNDWNNTMMRDGLLRNLFPKQLDVQAFRPSVVYLNGQYWGIHNIRERFDEDYVETHYNVDNSSVNMMEFHVNMRLHEIEGDGQSYFDLLDYIEQNGVSSTENYNHVKSVIDVENFALYQACNIMVKNTDWPGNNVKFWSSDEYDSKWRWMVYDLDFGFSDLYHNTLTFALDPNGPVKWPNPPESTYLLRRLTENQEFRYLFINCFADVLNTLWVPDYINPIIDKMSGDISSEIQAHMTRWGGSYGNWVNNINGLYNFAASRPAVVRDFVKNYYSLTGTYTLGLSVNDPSQGSIILNTINPKSYPWSGLYFNDVPVTLIAKPEKGYRFVRWEGASTSANDSITLNKNTATSIKAVFEEDDNYNDIIVINEIFFTNLTGETPNDWVELYNKGTQEVDLSDWTIKDEDDSHAFVIPQGITIASSGYLVICRDNLAYNSYYGKTNEGIGDMNFGLANGSDCVRLFNYQEVLVDSVGYINTIVTDTLFSYQRFVENDQVVWYMIDGEGTPNALNEKGIVLGKGTIVEKKDLTVEIFPNPFLEGLNIKFYLPAGGNVTINILSLDGKVVDNIENRNYTTGRHNATWNEGSKLPHGVYILQIGTDDQIISKKVIKR